MKVQAAVVNAVNHSYELEQLNLADIQDDEVRVKIVATGVCHSDDALRCGDVPYPLPGVFGHEGAGIVEAVGKGVTTVKMGDHVVLAYAYCSHCVHCLEGLPPACENWAALNWGAHRADGSGYFTRDDGTIVSNFFHQSSFASHTNVKEQNVIVVPKDADLRILGPLGCGLMTGAGTVLKALKATAGTSIAIFGTGAVGLAALMAAKIAGCSIRIAIDIHDSRLALATELGATHIVNSHRDDALEKIRAITNNAGVNYSVDTTGVSSVMKTSIDALGLCGIAAPVAVSKTDLKINPITDLVLGNKRIIGVLMGAAVPQIAIPELMAFHKAGLFPYDKLIKTYDFAQINQASADSLSGKTIKPVLIIDKTYAPG